MSTNIKLLLILLVFQAKLAAQSTFFVAPNGKDTHPGTQKQPFKSIERAILEARKHQDTVTVYLRAGLYQLSQPIVLTAADARKQNAPLLIKKFANEQINISGGSSLRLKWKPYKNGIFQAKIKPDLKFDQLIVNGQVQRMARYPNYDSTARFLGGTSADALSKERISRWAAPAGGFVHALHRHEWGDFHYRIMGKNAKGELDMEGGWQNNRRMGMHEKHRFVENILEELDTEHEWFYDEKSKILYFFPPKNLDLKTAKFETPQLAHLFEFKGSEATPVSNISLEGLHLTQTLRTFMDTKEPLLRSDWTIYRGGAVLLEGTENCSIRNCTFRNLGGNAVFFNNYNRNGEVAGCQISEIGASAVCFVGDPQAVRSPSFEYNEFVPLSQIDRTPGPKTNNYPADCKVFDNLMFNLGLVEKQTAALEISMSMAITVSHNTIYDVPRAGINISEGTWGGHVIEYNDVFNTVRESGDHGSFNSWGRDRFWHPNKRILDSIVETNYDLAFLDAIKPTILRNNRMRCDHGWDIDLDDGSSNYVIYNNLCLNGGLKLREGVKRTVENNIIVNNSFHPHVWFKNSKDVFRHNIVSTGYLPIQVPHWGKEVDFNTFPDSLSLKAAQLNGTDKGSIAGNPLFVDPQTGNYRVQAGSPALKVGFKNFSMDSFGVLSPRLKTLAKKVPLPNLIVLNQIKPDEIVDFMGAKIKSLSTLGERSATGMGEIKGVLVLEISTNSSLAKLLQANDVILSLNHIKTNKLRDFFEARMSVIGSSAEMIIFRNQKEIKIVVELNDKK